MEILLELEFPVPSLWGIGEYICTNERYNISSQSSPIFRYNCNIGVVSAFLSQICRLEQVQENTGSFDTIWSEIWCLSQKKSHEISCSSFTEAPQLLPGWVQSSCNSIQHGNMKLCESGVGGTYFVGDERHDGQTQLLSVFKPIDEEPGSPNNPKKKSFIPLLPWGGGAFREVAAFKLGASFVNVPETHLVEVSNPQGIIRKGSLQKYLQNEGDCSDVGANRFSVDSVHRVGIFDIRILNMDRNDENLLIQKINDQEWKLLPIDHTYAFPSKIDSYFNWQFWFQSKCPFSEDLLNYLSSINIDYDAKMLLETEIDVESVKNVTASTLLLQKAAKMGFNLFEISLMVSGKQNDLVDILTKVKEFHEENISLSAIERVRIFRKIVEEKIDMFIEEKQKEKI